MEHHRLRIFHILDHSVPLHSGYSFRTLATLTHQRQLGWDTFHITSAKHHLVTAPEEDVDGFHFYRTAPSNSALHRLPGLQQLAVICDLRARVEHALEQVHPDILHAHSPALNAVAVLRARRRRSIPLVYELRALWEDAAVDHGTTREGSARYRAGRALETYALRKVDAVITISEGLRGDIVARGIPENRVTVIPNAVDVERFTTGRLVDPELREQLGLTNKTVLGFIGSFYAYEGLDLLLEAVPLIRRAHGDVRLLLVGGGFQEDALRQQAAAVGVADIVQFIGRVPHDRVQRYYNLMDVLVYPRHSMRLTELVTPLKPLEAMAQGRLVVASDVGGHRELIRDGETGVLFRAGDAQALARAIVDLLQRPQTWDALRVNGRRYVERERSWSAVVERYRPVYEELAHAAGRPR